MLHANEKYFTSQARRNEKNSGGKGDSVSLLTWLADYEDRSIEIV